MSTTNSKPPTIRLNNQPWANSSPSCCAITPHKEFGLFCAGCSIVVCTNCTPEHLSHELMTIESAEVLLKKRLTEMIDAQRIEVLETTPRNILVSVREDCAKETEKLRKIFKMLHDAIDESEKRARQRMVSHANSMQEYIMDNNVASGPRQTLLDAIQEFSEPPISGNLLTTVVKYTTGMRVLTNTYTEWCDCVRSSWPHLRIDLGPAEEIVTRIRGLFNESFLDFGEGFPAALNFPPLCVDGAGAKVAIAAKDKKRRKAEAFPAPPKRSTVGTQMMMLSRVIGGNSNNLGETDIPNGLLTCPKAFTIDENGFIIVADASNHRIQVFRSDGAFHFTFGFPGPSSGTLNNPFKVVLIRDPKEPTGDAYVVADHSLPADPSWLNQHCNSKIAPDRHGRVQIFSRDGIFRRKIATPDVVRITSLGSNGEIVFVVDGEANVVFAYEGATLIRKFCFNRNVGELSEICVYDEMMLACDYRCHRIAVMNMATEKVVANFGDGHLAYPNGIHVDVSAGVIFVADSHENFLRVTMFDLTTWGFMKAFVYNCEKVSHVVGIKQIPGTRELVVLNRPGKAIKFIAGFVLVFHPLAADPWTLVMNRCLSAMPLISSLPSQQLLPQPVGIERFVRMDSTVQPALPDAFAMLWDDPPPTIPPPARVLSEIGTNHENSGGDSIGRPHKRKSSSKKLTSNDENGDVDMFDDQPSPPRISRRSLGFGVPQGSSENSPQGSGEETRFEASLRAWELEKARASV